MGEMSSSESSPGTSNPVTPPFSRMARRVESSPGEMP